MCVDQELLTTARADVARAVESWTTDRDRASRFFGIACVAVGRERATSLAAREFGFHSADDLYRHMRGTPAEWIAQAVLSLQSGSTAGLLEAHLFYARAKCRATPRIFQSHLVYCGFDRHHMASSLIEHATQVEDKSPAMAERLFRLARWYVRSMKELLELCQEHNYSGRLASQLAERPSLQLAFA